MGLSIRVENQIHQEVRRLYDDVDESFIRACEAGPVGSTRRGIIRYLHTMLNPFQLGVLIDELEALPADMATDTVSDVVAAAREAIKLRGYLYFIGD